MWPVRGANAGGCRWRRLWERFRSKLYDPAAMFSIGFVMMTIRDRGTSTDWRRAFRAGDGGLRSGTGGTIPDATVNHFLPTSSQNEDKVGHGVLSSSRQSPGLSAGQLSRTPLQMTIVSPLNPKTASKSELAALCPQCLKQGAWFVFCQEIRQLKTWERTRLPNVTKGGLGQFKRGLCCFEAIRCSSQPAIQRRLTLFVAASTITSK